MRFFRIEEDSSTRYTGNLNAAHRRGLPGVQPCPECGLGTVVLGLEYPCVDLSSLPAPELKKLSNPAPVPQEEYERLRALVQPFVPGHAVLEPGAEFGPLTGTGSGTFGQLFMQANGSLCMRHEALERLQGAGVSGLQGCPIDVRFRGKNPPTLLNMQLEVHGRFHPDCLKWTRKPPCPRCGTSDVEGPMPDPAVLDASTLPTGMDLFRLIDAPGFIVATERFVDAARQLELDGVVFRELEALFTSS
ncbi:double-CXXCG motif protein [Pyxidicoccus sp. 3LG]